MVEFALCFPLLFAIFAGSFEFGYSFYIYNKLQTAVRGGARYASLREYTGTAQGPTSAYLTAVKNFTVSGNPATATPPVVPGLTTSDIAVTVTMVDGVPRAVSVAVTGYKIKAVFKDHTLASKPVGNFRFAGRVASL